MTPFMQMRLWWRRGSVAQRATASVAALIVVGLAAWVLVPTGSDNTTNVSSGNVGAGTQAGSGRGGTRGGSAGGGAGGSVNGGAAGGGTQAAG